MAFEYKVYGGLVCDAISTYKCDKIWICEDPFQYPFNYTRCWLFLAWKKKFVCGLWATYFFLLNYVEFNEGDGNSNIFKNVFICKPRFI